MFKPRARLSPCAARLSFLRALRRETHRAKACIRCRIDGDSHVLVPQKSRAYRKQEVPKRHATPAIAPLSSEKKDRWRCSSSHKASPRRLLAPFSLSLSPSAPWPSPSALRLPRATDPPRSDT